MLYISAHFPFNFLVNCKNIIFPSRLKLHHQIVQLPRCYIQSSPMLINVSLWNRTHGKVKMQRVHRSNYVIRQLNRCIGKLYYLWQLSLIGYLAFILTSNWKTYILLVQLYNFWQLSLVGNLMFYFKAKQSHLLQDMLDIPNFASKQEIHNVSRAKIA